MGHAMIYYSTSPDPELADDSWFELPLAVDPVHLSAPPPPRVRVVDQGRVMMENGVEEVRLECDFVAATAIKLIVLGSDAANGCGSWEHDLDCTDTVVIPKGQVVLLDVSLPRFYL